MALQYVGEDWSRAPSNVLRAADAVVVHETLTSSHVAIDSQVRTKIEYLRIRNQLTVSRLASLTRISEAVLQQYERGTRFPSAVDINRLQEVLQTKLVP